LTAFRPRADNDPRRPALRVPGSLVAHGRHEENSVAGESHGPMHDAAWESDCAARAVAGNHEAFEKLVSVYGSRIYTHVFRMLHNREEAEDVVQEAFLRAYRNLATYDRARPFRNWLYTIASNLALNAIRARQRRGAAIALDFDADPAEVAATDTAADELAARGDLGVRIARALQFLPPQPAALVHLHYMEGMTIREAADMLDMREDAAKVALHRARKRLRGLLKDE